MKVLQIVIKFCQSQNINLIIPEKNNIIEKYFIDQRGTKSPLPLVILFPISTKQVKSIIDFANSLQINIVPQTGNTGLVGGASTTKDDILLSLEKMAKIENFNKIDKTITCQSGVTLDNLQQFLEQENFFFPLSIGSHSQCGIGGLISTNAGGCSTLKYGNMQALTIGIEAVFADGTIWSDLKGLRKDNSGYKISQLLCGSEGTLAIITKAILKIQHKPNAKVTGFIAVDNIENAVNIYTWLEKNFYEYLTSCELISHRSAKLVINNIPNVRQIFSQKIMTRPHYQILFELESSMSFDELQNIFTLRSDEILNLSGIIDIIIANSQSQTKQFWQLRHHISEAMRTYKNCLKHDISVPLSSIAEFITQANKSILEFDNKANIIDFGHLGDGNIHYDILLSQEKSPQITKKIETIIHEIVINLGGSISAEHGIGIKKIEQLTRFKDKNSLKIFHKIKNSFDSNNILNRNKLLKSSQKKS